MMITGMPNLAGPSRIAESPECQTALQSGYVVEIIQKYTAKEGMFETAEELFACCQMSQQYLIWSVSRSWRIVMSMSVCLSVRSHNWITNYIADLHYIYLHFICG